MIIEWLMNTLAVLGCIASVILMGCGVAGWALGIIEFRGLGFVEGSKVYVMGVCFIAAGCYVLRVCVDFMGFII